MTSDWIKDIILQCVICDMIDETFTNANSIIDGVFVGFRYQNPAVFMLLD